MEKKESTTKTRMSASDIRSKLKALTIQLKGLHEAGKVVGDKPNDWLKFYYAKLGHTDLKTFDEWKAEGWSVKKGEKALHLWTRKRVFSKKTEGGEDSYEGYGYCCLFSRLQVEPKAAPVTESVTEA